MAKQVALIRGINVGTAKRVSMAELRLLIEELGCTDVRTLLNSGNVVFRVAAKHQSDVAAQIEAEIAKKLGVSARVLTVTGEDFGTVVAENPLADVVEDPARFLVAFVKDAADLAQLEPLAKQTWSPDVLALGSRAAYLWCASGILESKLLIASNRLLW